MPLKLLEDGVYSLLKSLNSEMDGVNHSEPLDMAQELKACHKSGHTNKCVVQPTLLLESVQLTLATKLTL